MTVTLSTLALGSMPRLQGDHHTPLACNTAELTQKLSPSQISSVSPSIIKSFDSMHFVV